MQLPRVLRDLLVGRFGEVSTTVEVPASTFASPIAAVLATPTGDIFVKAAPRQSWGLFAVPRDVGR